MERRHSVARESEPEDWQRYVPWVFFLPHPRLHAGEDGSLEKPMGADENISKKNLFSLTKGLGRLQTNKTFRQELLYSNQTLQKKQTNKKHDHIPPYKQKPVGSLTATPPSHIEVPLGWRLEQTKDLHHHPAVTSPNPTLPRVICANGDHCFRSRYLLPIKLVLVYQKWNINQG